MLCFLLPFLIYVVASVEFLSLRGLYFFFIFFFCLSLFFFCVFLASVFLTLRRPLALLASNKENFAGVDERTELIFYTSQVNMQCWTLIILEILMSPAHFSGEYLSRTDLGPVLDKYSPEKSEAM